MEKKKYNLCSPKTDTIQIPLEVYLSDDNDFITNLLGSDKSAMIWTCPFWEVSLIVVQLYNMTVTMRALVGVCLTDLKLTFLVRLPEIQNFKKPSFFVNQQILSAIGLIN